MSDDSDLIFVGANPGLVLRHDGDVVCAASLWLAKWSILGAGAVAVLAGRPWPVPVAVGTSPELARWLVGDLTRYFPEFADVPLELTTMVSGEVDFVTLNESYCHCRVVMADMTAVDLRLDCVVDVRPVQVAGWVLGGREYSLSNVLSPCARATVSVNNTALVGAVNVEPGPRGPVSSAFIATNERWAVTRR